MSIEESEFGQLTPREIEVLRLIASGRTSKQIAVTLGIRFKTAVGHRTRIMAKLGIHEIAGLTRYAIREGYIDVYANAGAARQRQLFQVASRAHEEYRAAMEAYSKFLEERGDLGFDNPDGALGARRLHTAQRLAHEKYHAAFVALKEFLMPQFARAR